MARDFQYKAPAYEGGYTICRLTVTFTDVSFFPKHTGELHIIILIEEVWSQRETPTTPTHPTHSPEQS
jgi:hypothetical protein